MKSDFLRGMSHGVPIALGYLFVSFGFGISAARSGLSVFEASVISATNLTSAGQAAGIDVIAENDAVVALKPIFEMILVQLTINIRYSLMALSLSQKLDGRFTTRHRLLASYGITDEIFGVCSAQKGLLVPPYMYGMILIAAVGWVLGTFLGAYAGQLLPESLSSAMGILLYGMFLAIIIPPSKRQRSVFVVVLISAVLSVLFFFFVDVVSSGLSMIICAVVAASVGAVLFPVEDEEGEE